MILCPMRLVVDNSAGGDAQVAASLAEGLRSRGHAVELRQPDPESMFDTSVHLLSTGVELRVDEPPTQALLDEISAVVRDVLGGHPSLRRRSRAVPVTLDASGRVLTWIDAFD